MASLLNKMYILLYILNLTDPKLLSKIHLFFSFCSDLVSQARAVITRMKEDSVSHLQNFIHSHTFAFLLWLEMLSKCNELMVCSTLRFSLRYYLVCLYVIWTIFYQVLLFLWQIFSPHNVGKTWPAHTSMVLNLTIWVFLSLFSELISRMIGRLSRSSLEEMTCAPTALIVYADINKAGLFIISFINRSTII